MDDTVNNVSSSQPANGQTWQLAIVGGAALLLGLVLGYFGRGALGPEAMAAKTTGTAAAVAVQTNSAQNKEIMDAIIAQTRHFKGSADAPVTIIEFSDFQ